MRKLIKKLNIFKRLDELEEERDMDVELLKRHDATIDRLKEDIVDLRKTDMDNHHEIDRRIQETVEYIKALQEYLNVEFEEYLVDDPQYERRRPPQIRKIRAVKKDEQATEKKDVVEAIGGFPGHEHIHPVGPPVCKKCGDVKTVSALADTHSKRLHDAFDQMLFNKDEDGEGT